LIGAPFRLRRNSFVKKHVESCGIIWYDKVVQATKARFDLGVPSTRLIGWAWRCVVCSLVDPKRFTPEGTPFGSIQSLKHPYA
jgi:hypothetical protein